MPFTKAYGRTYNALKEGIELAKASGASQEAIDKLNIALEMIKLKADYDEEACTAPSPTLDKIEKETYEHDWTTAFNEGKTKWHFRPLMFSGPVEGQFLKQLVSIQKAKRVLEAGMFTGYSAQAMAEALPADGEMVSLEIDNYLEPLVKDLTKDSHHSKKMKCVIGHGTEEMKKMAQAGEKFDLIFLDGDKADYIDQFKISFDDGLLAAGGTLVIDNAYTMGQAYTPGVTKCIARDLLTVIKERTNLHRVLLPLNDGVMLVRRIEETEVDKV